MEEKSKKLIVTILSISIVTVMAGAAVSPALGKISLYFNDVNPFLIQMILTMPCLFILLTNFCFCKISNLLGTKQIAILGLFLYLSGGICGGLANNIYLLLVLRAVVGIGTGLLMPLSTGLLAYYFDGKEQGKLMGYSVAMNNLGGIIAMILSGYLSSINWRYSFFVYLMGLIVLFLVILFLPNTTMQKNNTTITNKIISKKLIYFIEMFILNLAFYLYTTNFSIISLNENITKAESIGLVMSTQTIGALITAMFFGKLQNKLGIKAKYIGGLSFVLSYIFLLISYSSFISALGLFFNGIGLGIIMPWINSNAVKDIEKENSTKIMSFMSISMYLGQFLSPLIISLLISAFKIEYPRFPYLAGIVLSISLLLLLKLNKNKN